LKFEVSGLVERYTNPFFFPPNDMTLLLELIAGHEQRETVGDEQWGYDFERCASRRKVANSAVNSATAELYSSGFQSAATLRFAVFIHVK
jgi:hypothetical protein